MKKKRFQMVISAAGMAICLLCGSCGRKTPVEEPETTAEEIEESEETESMAEPAEEVPEVDYLTCPSGTIVEKELTEEDVDALFLSEEIPDEVFVRMDGVTYQENDNISREDLRYLRMLYYGFDGNTHVGEMVANAQIAEELREIFRELYENRYPIEKMCLMDDYGGDDDLAVADNNTSCFNYRVVAGSTKLSKHALGLAIDINPFYNPYVTYPNGVEHISPAGSEAYADRSADFPYKIGGEGDLCLQLFQERGYTWGGNWKTLKDYQHFQKEPKETAAEAGTTIALENGAQISLNESWQYADHSAIHSGSAVLYRAEENRKNIVVGVNAGHGTSGGASVKTLCHPDGSPKTTGGSTAQGATTAAAVSGGMTFADGTRESAVTLQMARILRDKLLAAGYDVLMLRDGDDVQLDNVARTVICNNVADCHIALHWDGDGLSYDKGCFYISVPDAIKGMEPVASHWQQHNSLGAALITGLQTQGAAIYKGGSMSIDLTQTSYSTIPSVDIELGNAASDHSDTRLNQLAEGLLTGLNQYYNQ